MENFALSRQISDGLSPPLARNWKYMEVITLLFRKPWAFIGFVQTQIPFGVQDIFHLNNSDKTKNPNELKSQTSVVKILFTWKHSFQHIVRFPLLYSDDLIDVIVTPLGDLLDMMFDQSLRFCTKFLQYLKMIGDMFWDMTWVLTRDLIQVLPTYIYGSNTEASKTKLEGLSRAGVGFQSEGYPDRKECECSCVLGS